MSFMPWLFYIVFLAATVQYSFASIGDRSREFQDCFMKCESRNCSTRQSLQVFIANQPWIDKISGWTCLDDCYYNCMWYAVGEFHQSGKRTPQFYGKWPFIRMLGLQEPASAIFSLLNLAAHLKWIRTLRNKVDNDAPMFSVWMMYGLVSINAWTWSTIFHARDVSWTEKMDYFSAFSIVTYSLMAFCVRMFGSWTWKSMVSAVLCLLLFLRHIYLMTFINFDYGYNMKVNLGVGLVNSLCWLVWCFRHWEDQKHARKAGLAITLLIASTCLEILEFQPIFWMFDSHSLWHLTTAPIHGIWYEFVIEDCIYLNESTDNGVAKKSHSARKMI